MCFSFSSHCPIQCWSTPYWTTLSWPCSFLYFEIVLYWTKQTDHVASACLSSCGHFPFRVEVLVLNYTKLTIILFLLKLQWLLPPPMKLFCTGLLKTDPFASECLSSSSNGPLQCLDYTKLTVTLFVLKLQWPLPPPVELFCTGLYQTDHFAFVGFSSSDTPSTCKNSTLDYIELTMLFLCVVAPATSNPYCFCVL